MSFANPDRANLVEAEDEIAVPPGKRARPADIWVGLRIRMRRFELGMSQQRMAELMGLNQAAQIRKWERAEHRLVIARLWDIARVLRVDPTYFWQGYHPEEAPDWPIEPSEVIEVMTREGVSLLLDIAQLTPTQRDVMKQMAASFARGNAIDRANAHG